MPKLGENPIRNKIAIESQTRNGKVVQTVDGKGIHHKFKFIPFVGSAVDVRLIIQHLTAFIRYKYGILWIILITRFIIGLIDIKCTTHIPQYRFDGHQSASR